VAVVCEGERYLGMLALADIVGGIREPAAAPGALP